MYYTLSHLPVAESGRLRPVWSMYERARWTWIHTLVLLPFKNFGGTRCNMCDVPLVG